MKPKRKVGLLAVWVGVFVLHARDGLAIVTPILSPFGGGVTEGFEAFSKGPIVGSLVVLNGQAQLVGGSGGATIFGAPDILFSLGYNGYAQPRQTKALGGSGVSVSFANPVTTLGAYWGTTADTGVTGDLTMTLFDTHGGVTNVTIPHATSNQLAWFGVSSDMPIERFEVTGDAGFAVDDLQVEVVVPEPGQLVVGILLGGIVALKSLKELLRRK